MSMNMRILRGVKKVNSGLTVPESSHHLEMCFCFYKKIWKSDKWKFEKWKWKSCCPFLKIWHRPNTFRSNSHCVFVLQENMQYKEKENFEYGMLLFKEESEKNKKMWISTLVVFQTIADVHFFLLSCYNQNCHCYKKKDFPQTLR